MNNEDHWSGSLRPGTIDEIASRLRAALGGRTFTREVVFSEGGLAAPVIRTRPGCRIAPDWGDGLQEDVRVFRPGNGWPPYVGFSADGIPNSFAAERPLPGRAEGPHDYGVPRFEFAPGVVTIKHCGPSGILQTWTFTAEQPATTDRPTA